MYKYVKYINLIISEDAETNDFMILIFAHLKLMDN